MSSPFTPERGTHPQFPPSSAPDPLAKNYRGLSGKLGVWLLLGGLGLMFALISLLVFSTPLTRNDLGLLGGLHVATDDDVVVYVGDRRVGAGTVDISWNDLLGAASRPPLAAPLTNEPTDAELATLLGGDGATLLWRTKGPTGTHRGKQDANFQFGQVLLERGDGVFDHVLLVECQFPNATGAWQSLLIPIRARKAGDQASGYFPSPGVQSGGNVSRGMIPSRRDYATFELKLTINPGAAPTEVADRLAGASLWAPAPQ